MLYNCGILTEGILENDFDFRSGHRPGSALRQKIALGAAKAKPQRSIARDWIPSLDANIVAG
jgi:hypothetical protein